MSLLSKMEAQIVKMEAQIVKMEAPIIKDEGFKLSIIRPPILHFFFFVRQPNFGYIPLIFAINRDVV